MVRYRNVQHGRVVERSREDKWLEASAGWTRIEDELCDYVPTPGMRGEEEQDEGSKD